MYSEAEIAQALAAVELNGGSIRQAAADVGIPEATIRHWLDGTRRLSPSQIAAAKDELGKRSFRVADRFVSELETRDLADVSTKDCAIIAGIAIDKFLALNGEPTSIVEHRHTGEEDSRRDRINSLFGTGPVLVVDATTVPAEDVEPEPAEGSNSTLPPPADPEQSGEGAVGSGRETGAAGAPGEGPAAA
jgi:transposase-like protein